MTDDTGLLEHGLGKIPRRREGYSTDDNARAIWTCLVWLDHVAAEERATLLRLVDTYLSFLLWVQHEDGGFQNDVAYDRTFLRERRSDDCFGRAVWALAVAWTKLESPDRRIAVREMLERAYRQVPRLSSARGFAYTLAALCLLWQHAKTDASDEVTAAFHAWVERNVPRWVTELERNLLSMYSRNAQTHWRWFEPVLTYGNGVLPWSLLVAYTVTERQDTLSAALHTLDFLIRQMTGQGGIIRPVGNQGWCTPERRAEWDQQPIDVMKLALAAAMAYRVTGDPAYRDVVRRCRAWFYGENDLGVPLADAEDGSCCDGLTPVGVNVNRGAESTLSYLLTEAMFRNVEVDAHEYHRRERVLHSFACI